MIGAERLTQLLDWAKLSGTATWGSGCRRVITIGRGEQEVDLGASKLVVTAKRGDTACRISVRIGAFRRDGLFTFNFEGQRSSARRARHGEATSTVLAQASPRFMDSNTPCRTRRTCASSRPHKRTPAAGRR